jgi:radical SAM protein with 4Fe4S-binding SPASM domain
MFDIHFYMKAHKLTQEMREGKQFDRDFIIDKFNQLKREEPVIYNIETTNACNMRCRMCPRTTKMTRKIETLGKDEFIGAVNQLRPWTIEEWMNWENFVAKEYGIINSEMSENHFFLYIIPKVIQLHGYGDPLLDKNMDKYVNLLNKKDLLSYFSCNPANISVDKSLLMFDNGLNFIKYSIESVDDESHKKIRGESSNFSESYRKILELLNKKEQRGYKTIIIITMLDLNRSNQKEEFKKLRKAFEGLDVYIYMKSEDQQWYRKEYHGTNSVHWSEICRHPWMSMTIKSNSDVTMCMEDYNNEIILGNIKEHSLYDIWNGKKYEEFRNMHFNLSKGIKCNEECDMRLVGEYLKK